MSKPVVGIVTNPAMLNEEYPVQATGLMNIRAVAEVCGCTPMLIPSLPDVVSTEALMEICDGVLLTGGRPNVHPEEYGQEPTEAHGEFDRDRDWVVLPLIRACVDAGRPVLGVCRGFQEINVAYGGTLHPEIRDLPGRMNHRMPPDGTLEEKFEHRHIVSLAAGGKFSQIFGRDEVLVNSLHGQGIDVAGERIVIEGHAPDRTPEAIHVEGATGFAMAVQWHPEWNASRDPVSKPLFEAFGAAVRAASGRSQRAA